MKSESLRQRAPVRWLTVTAVFMAMNIALSSFGMPVPGGCLYLNDIVICTAAILLDPLGAFAVGGIGAFLRDMFFYPAPMFVSLVHPRTASSCYLPLRPRSTPKTLQRGRTWCNSWSDHHGSGLLLGQSLPVQHS